MDSNENVYAESGEHRTKSHNGVLWGIGAALALALGLNGYLIYQTGEMKDEIARIQNGTDLQFAKVDSSTAQIASENRKRFEALSDSLTNASNSSLAAVKKLRMEAQKQDDDLRNRMEQQQQELTGELTVLKDASEEVNSKISEVSNNVGSVKTDVDGVRAQVESTHSVVDQHSAELKRVMGDMGVMSGLIATNSKDLDVLRQLGDRNYYEFTLTKNQSAQKVGQVALTLKKADAKRNRYTMTVFADDKLVEKKDRTVNEPVQIYTGGMRQPVEIVVNQVSKDKISGYVATPKVTLSRR